MHIGINVGLVIRIKITKASMEANVNSNGNTERNAIGSKSNTASVNHISSDNSCGNDKTNSAAIVADARPKRLHAVSNDGGHQGGKHDESAEINTNINRSSQDSIISDTKPDCQ